MSRKRKRAAPAQTGLLHRFRGECVGRCLRRIGRRSSWPGDLPAGGRPGGVDRGLPGGPGDAAGVKVAGGRGDGRTGAHRYAHTAKTSGSRPVRERPTVVCRSRTGAPQRRPTREGIGTPTQPGHPGRALCGSDTVVSPPNQDIRVAPCEEGRGGSLVRCRYRAAGLWPAYPAADLAGRHRAAPARALPGRSTWVGALLAEVKGACPAVPGGIRVHARVLPLATPSAPAPGPPRAPERGTAQGPSRTEVRHAGAIGRQTAPHPDPGAQRPRVAAARSGAGRRARGTAPGR
jgi:hypothetical protein